MSDWQIQRAALAALIARLNSLAVSTVAEDRAEVVTIQREIAHRIGCGDCA